MLVSLREQPRALAAVVLAVGVVVGPGASPAAAQEPEADRLQRQAEKAFGEGRVPEAARIYQRALRADPNHVASLKDLAWIRATSSDTGLRRPAEAVKLAERAFERMIVGFNSRKDRAAIPPQYDKLQILRVGASLGAAYAAAGRFRTAMDPDYAALVSTGEINERSAIGLSGSSRMQADTVMNWALDMSLAIHKESPSPTTEKLVEDMRKLAQSFAEGKPIKDGRPQPGTLRQ
jgi:tetratricopeptide (TPR) repeat protein